ncbi:MAG: transglycosylase SLT domain-containing protein [Candidatus Pacearchaeota archaeon]|nr:transglycosylase SLT domain-containing protein [Candidatus Pacearchaeota archaeon]
MKEKIEKILYSILAPAILASTLVLSNLKNYNKDTKREVRINQSLAYRKFPEEVALKNFCEKIKDKILYWQDYYLNSRSFWIALEIIKEREDEYKKIHANLEKILYPYSKILEEKNINPYYLLNAIEIVESYGDTNCKSHAGAVGPYQLIPHLSGISETMAKNPLISRELCLEELKRYLKIFKDLELALAAYNAGPGRVKKAIKKVNHQLKIKKKQKKEINFEDIKKFLPKETRNYVPKVFAVYLLIKDLDNLLCYRKNRDCLRDLIFY